MGKTLKVVVLVMLELVVSACSKSPARESSAEHESPATAALTGTKVIAIDGSSTVFPITEAVAEEFQKKNSARVTIGVSGTGGGFKKLCAGEVAIVGASRPIKPSEEQACAAGKVEYIELPVAYDGIAVIVNPKNDWAKSMTVAELKELWQPEAQAKVRRWSQVRSGWPDEEIHLFGAGVDSGTYDYFTKAIVGEEHKSRGDFTSSEDDNVLVQGISRDPLALGFFGYAYYAENEDKLKVVAIDDENETNGAGAIVPSPAAIGDGTYQPLSRPIFIYVGKTAAARPEVHAFVEFYLTNGETLVQEARYVPLPKKAYELAHRRFTQGKTGSVFAGRGSSVGVTVEDLLARE